VAVAGQVENLELLTTQEVSFTSEGTKIPGYLARPRGGGPYSGLMLLHDIFGVSDHARDVARRLANVGFATLVPDCFARIELGTDESRVRERAARLDDSLTVRDIENAAALLRALPFCNGKVGTVGFCMGGRSALLLACSSDKIDATIDCWGGSITPDTGVGALHPAPVVDLVKNIRRPVYAYSVRTTRIPRRHTLPSYASGFNAKASSDSSRWRRSPTPGTPSSQIIGPSAIVNVRRSSCGPRWYPFSRLIFLEMKH
jgi:dienelactone hydrolase